MRARTRTRRSRVDATARTSRGRRARVRERCDGVRDIDVVDGDDATIDDDDDDGGVSWTMVACVGETGSGVECVDVVVVVDVVVDVVVVVGGFARDVCGVGARDDDARSSGVGVGVGREDAGAGRCGRRRCDCVFA